MAGKIGKALINDTTESKEFQDWSKKMFTLVVINGRRSVCREEKPIGIREKLFKILTTAHRKCEHGGQKETSVEVNRLYSWIPEELIWVFIKICPTCQFKSSSQEEVTEGVLFVCGYDGYNPNDIHHRDFPQWLRPIPVRNQMISTPSNASSHIGLLPHGISLSTPVDNRTNPGSENFRFNVTNEDQTKISEWEYRKKQLLSVSLTSDERSDDGSIDNDGSDDESSNLFVASALAQLTGACKVDRALRGSDQKGAKP
ncbi:hypothetical protein ACJ73_04593 [Blastomyces percursus]|uniref:Integrase zinc-binding domain-containing protein n=1 Tax=Blastomyces percursus TaxID=1658174 RepID=A0A1J9QUX7_9EURO|nr:hypothetical protein ACJ73_04593 [Blastomyces percursus]